MTRQRNIRGKLTDYREWSTEETTLLCETWPQGGMRACRPLFPDREYGSIKGKAEKLGLRVAGRAAHRAQGSTDWIDAQIRREYATGAPKVKALAKRLDRTYGWVKWRAGELGVRRATGSEPYMSWTPEEDAIIQRGLDDEKSVTQIQRRLRLAGHLRTGESIRRRVWLNYGGFNRAYYSPNETAQLFGVCYDQVMQWIKAGKLFARREPGISVTDGAGMQYHIYPTSISKFMREHLTLWDHRKMRKEVLVDFLLGENAALGALDQLKGARAA
jgi:hypothetical protein